MSLKSRTCTKSSVLYPVCQDFPRSINALIKSTPEGLPVLLNRNPTIALGGILQMFCIGMTDTLTIGIPLQILKFLAADFDGVMDTQRIQ